MRTYTVESVRNIPIPEELEDEVCKFLKAFTTKYTGVMDNEHSRTLMEHDIELFNKQREENHPLIDFNLKLTVIQG